MLMFTDVAWKNGICGWLKYVVCGACCLGKVSISSLKISVGKKIVLVTASSIWQNIIQE